MVLSIFVPSKMDKNGGFHGFSTGFAVILDFPLKQHIDIPNFGWQLWMDVPRDPRSGQGPKYLGPFHRITSNVDQQETMDFRAWVS